ncbi:hypothetical protein [Seonamhaeicola marinus]|uniref:Glycosyltransferase family 1 protein n=1 Tax=Seonamhaeicola marinus TaxID=1912246 RepID=A0A5D0HKN0_9FLAO|nr:hypothetical protein [Seonamhaeicola marinus]TYA71871.1 hypothetical protein FUA24_20185 [Seonamhaeicola marinus]
MINCVVEYKNIPHLNQLYTGFKLLHDAQVINLEFSNRLVHKELKDKSVIRVVINESIIIYYDTLDGYNWIDAETNENIEYFRNTFKCDYYFKRSFSKTLESQSLVKLLPLGLYYNITPYFDIEKLNSIESVKKKLKNNSLFRRLMKVNANFFVKDFEHYPDLLIDDKEIRILFSARLWPPDGAKNEESKLQREAINNFRITIVKTLKKEYGERFIGGISTDSYSSSVLEKEFLLPFEFTNRKNYLKLMKSASICIATTGIHSSIGGKLTEYVCAARAIISEPLYYEVPGDFNKNENYLEFVEVNDLIRNIDYLTKSPEVLKSIMENNRDYYHSYLKPDALVYNTLNLVLSNV